MAADTESPGTPLGDDDTGPEEGITKRQLAPENASPPEATEGSAEPFVPAAPEEGARPQFGDPDTAPDTEPDLELPALDLEPVPETVPERDPLPEPNPLSSAAEAQPFAWSLPEEPAGEEWEHWPPETAQPIPEPPPMTVYSEQTTSPLAAPTVDTAPDAAPESRKDFESPQNLAASESEVPFNAPLGITPVAITPIAIPPLLAADPLPEQAIAPLPADAPPPPPSAPPTAAGPYASTYMPPMPPPREPAAQTSAGMMVFPPLAVPSIAIPSPASPRGRLDRARSVRLARDALRFAGYAVAGYLSLVVVLIGLYRFVDPPGSTLMLFRWVGGTEIDQRWVPIEQISPQLVRAVVVAEDGRFCDHWGIDFDAMGDAIEQAVDGLPRGASTISMQVVKNVFLWPSKSYVRKILELPLTVLAELAWPKRRMLEIYLNVAEWGPGVFGAEAAAQHHFNRSAARLGEREAALLAASLPNPVRRDAGDPGPLTSRKASIIQARMRAAGPVTCVTSRE